MGLPPGEEGDFMEDSRIVELYWQRDEAAIRETERKYGRYLMKIARGILGAEEDSQECVSDAYLRAWNTIPPQKPEALSAYLAKLARRASIDCFRRRNREKRRASQYALSLSELEECLSGGNTTEEKADVRLLAQAMEAYLKTLSPEARNMFLFRYYYMDSIREVASFFACSEAKVKSSLHRTRLGLKEYLEQEGFVL